MRPGNPVRLRYAYVIRATSVEKDAAGHVTAVHAEYLPETKSGSPGQNSVKTKTAIHWLPVQGSIPAEVRVFERLFTDPHPDAGEGNFLDLLNPNSKQVLKAYVEPSLANAQPDDKFQFERNGYFVADLKDHAATGAGVQSGGVVEGFLVEVNDSRCFVSNVLTRSSAYFSSSIDEFVAADAQFAALEFSPPHTRMISRSTSAKLGNWKLPLSSPHWKDCQEPSSLNSKYHGSAAGSTPWSSQERSSFLSSSSVANVSFASLTTTRHGTTRSI